MATDCEDCREVEDLVDAMGKLFTGKSTANILQAMALMLGYIEAEAPRPNIDNLMDLVRNSATDAFHHHRAALEAVGKIGRPQ